MALSSHELYLVLRARDEASRVLRSFGNEFTKLSGKQLQAAQRQLVAGAALTTVGIGIAGAGLAGLHMMNDMTNAAAMYNQQVASTLTQVDKVGIGFQGLSDMGLRVAKVLPVPFEQIQPALYDIFSSIDTNAPGAEVLLRNIGKAAVGGSVDMETAGRATIAVLNAYKMPAQQVTKVNDIMFQLVRKGVGTYGQFTSVIGRSIPSAIRAGQSFETLAGMMAFMTRNGLSAANASTSAARALDALSNPKTVSKFHKWGVELVDSKGKFRPVVDIIQDMRKKMEGLTPAAKSAKLSELFKGSGGTIQAMRFFNTALADSNNLLPEMTTAMHNAGGAADQAYKIMANTPQAQIQLMTNKYDAMKVTVGNQLLPIKLKLVSVLSRLLDAWDKLSPSVQKAIVWFVAIGSALAVVVGAVMVVAGGIVMLDAALALAGATMGGFLLAVGAVIAIIALLVVGIVLVVKHWDLIKAKGEAAWNAIKAGALQAWAGLANFRDNIIQFAQEVWSYLQPIVSRVWNDIKAGISSMVTTVKPYWDQFTAALSMVGGHVREFAIGAGNVLTHLFEFLKPAIYIVVGVFGILAGIVGGVLRVAFETAGHVIGALIQILTGVITFVYNVFTGHWKAAWDSALKILTGFLDITRYLIGGALKLVGTIIYNFVLGVINFFKHLWDVLVGHSIIPDMINGIIHWFSTLPGRVLAFISNLVSQAISKIASMASNVISRVTSFISTVVSHFSGMPGRVISAISSLAGRLFSTATTALSRMRDGVVSGVSTIIGYLSGVPGRLVSAVGALGGLLWGAGKALMDGLGSGIAAGWRAITGSVSAMAGWIKDHKGPKSVDLKLLYPSGQWIMQGLYAGIMSGVPKLTTMLHNISNVLARGINRAAAIGDHASLGTLRSLKAWIDARAKIMLNYANKHQAIVTQIQAQQKKLADILNAKVEYAKQVQDATSALGQMSQFVSNGVATDSQGIIDKLRGTLDAIKLFQQNIADLRARGLNQQSLDQIIQLGPEGGNALADSLRVGGPDAIKQINALEGQINQASAALGKSAAGAMYDSGIAAAQGIIKGLQSQQKALEATMTHLALTMVNTIKKKLGIHSPSTVLRGVSHSTIDGMRLGLTDRQYQLIRAASRVSDNVASALTPRPDMNFTPVGAGNGSGRFPGMPPVPTPTGPAVKVDVHTQEINPVKHSADLGWEIARRLGY